MIGVDGADIAKRAPALETNDWRPRGDTHLGTAVYVAARTKSSTSARNRRDGMREYMDVVLFRRAYRDTWNGAGREEVVSEK